jgi:prevent-host-death family protein
MASTMSAKELRASLPDVVRRVRKGARITVLYRSQPAFQIIPVDEGVHESRPFEEDSLYRAAPVGRSTDGGRASDHDAVLYKK